MNAVTILSTANFDSAVWTNKQHLAVGLAQKYDVLFIESLGLRRPSFSRADVRRIGARFARPGPHRSVDQRMITHKALPTVMRPNVIPFHSNGYVRRLNKYLLGRQYTRAERPQDDVLWTFSPIVYGLAEFHGPVIYHAVDLLHTFERVDQQLILKEERNLLQIADVVIASSTGVRTHLHSQGRLNVLLWENVADTQIYTSAARALGSMRQARAIFAGNLSHSKVDFQLILSIADSGIDVALAGPIAIDGAVGVDGSALRRVLNHPRITYLGVLEPTALANELARSQVGIIPYVLSEHTAGIFPMKVFEYLAAGLPVVSTKLGSLADYDHMIRLVDHGDFAAAAAHEAIQFDDNAASQRIALAAAHSWDSRILEATEVIEGFKVRKEPAC